MDIPERGRGFLARPLSLWDASHHGFISPERRGTRSGVLHYILQEDSRTRQAVLLFVLDSLLGEGIMNT